MWTASPPSPCTCSLLLFDAARLSILHRNQFSSHLISSHLIPICSQEVVIQGDEMVSVLASTDVLKMRSAFLRPHHCPGAQGQQRLGLHHVCVSSTSSLRTPHPMSVRPTSRPSTRANASPVDGSGPTFFSLLLSSLPDYTHTHTHTHTYSLNKHSQSSFYTLSTSPSPSLAACNGR